MTSSEQDVYGPGETLPHIFSGPLSQGVNVKAGNRHIHEAILIGVNKHQYGTVGLSELYKFLYAAGRKCAESSVEPRDSALLVLFLFSLCVTAGQRFHKK